MEFIKVFTERYYLASITFSIFIFDKNRDLDIFEPVFIICGIVTLSIGLSSIILLLQGHGDIIHYWVNYRGVLSKTLVLNLIGIISYFFGYYGLSWKLVKNNYSSNKILPKSPIKIRSSWIWFLLLTSFFIFILWMKIAGVEWKDFNIFEEDVSYRSIFNSSTNIFYLYQICLTWPALILLALGFRKQQKQYKILLGLIWLSVFLVYFGSGSRGMLLRLFLSTGIYFYLVKRKRPKITVLLAFLFGILTISGALAIVRLPKSSSNYVGLNSINIKDTV